MTRSKALHWIDGEWRDSPRHRQSIDPATSESIGTYADGGGRLNGLAAMEDFTECKHIALDAQHASRR